MAVGTLERQQAALDCGDVAYLRHGSGPPLLLVHGIPTSARLWEPLLGDLGRHFDCIAPDLLGLGRSRARPGFDVGSPGQAEMLAQLLDHLGLDDVCLALHDQGGAHGLRFLEGHGQRVRALALANIVCYDNWEVPAIRLTRLLCQRPQALAALGRSGLATAAFLRVWPIPQTVYRGPLPAALGDDWLGALRTGGADLDAFAAYVVAQSPRHTTETVPVLQSWSKPAFVLWGAHDLFLVPSWAVRLCADIPGAPDQPVLVPFSGHFLQVDAPRTAAALLSDFFTGAPA